MTVMRVTGLLLVRSDTDRMWWLTLGNQRHRGAATAVWQLPPSHRACETTAMAAAYQKSSVRVMFTRSPATAPRQIGNFGECGRYPMLPARPFRRPPSHFAAGSDRSPVDSLGRNQRWLTPVGAGRACPGRRDQGGSPGGAVGSAVTLGEHEGHHSDQEMGPRSRYLLAETERWTI